MSQGIPSNYWKKNKTNIVSLPFLSSNSRFKVNDTIETIINQLFIDTWSNETSYERYYNACSPSHCNYSYRRRWDIFNGLSIGLHFATRYIINPADFTKVQHQYNNIQVVLTTQLKTLRQQFPKHFPTPVYVLSAVDDSVKGQFEQSLQQASKYYTGERIMLIPYHLETFHWIGIVIKFEANGQIKQAEYIDPVNGTNAVPDRLQSRFAKIYPNIIMQKRDLHKHNDPKLSSTLTIKNLLAAARNDNQTSASIEKNEHNVVSISNDGNEYKLCESKQNIQGRIMLSEIMQGTEDAEKEMKVSSDEISKLNPDDDKLKVHKLEEKSRSNLSDAPVLQGEIKETEERINELENQKRKEPVFLNESQELNKLSEQISIFKSAPPTPVIDPTEVAKIRLRNDLDAMPICAEKTINELLVLFEENTFSQQKYPVSAALQNLKDQLKREELLSETNRAILQNLEICITNNDCSSTVRCLGELLRQIRSLNLPEIRRLVEKSKEAAELIRDKEIILLVGETGTGKSTTIQFLAGLTMQETRVEIATGKFLEHITAVGSVKNPQLNNLISSPLSKSETRYITPVTIQLKDIFGPQRNGFVILCDAPGFDDTAGTEVDIANNIGVIEALKGTKSVKILALSSYTSLGDRGQGIQKLANILINMVYGIEDKLDSIFYAFTKYPKATDINALLIDIKKSRVNSDRIFITVLTDMIKKTENGAYKIDPIHGDPKILFEKLERTRGIRYPEEIFRLSMSEKTRASIANHVQRDEFSIIRAMNYKDLNLVSYYLNDLKILHDLIKQDIIQNTYQDSIRLVSVGINDYCTQAIQKFNRILSSQDGLSEKDILVYKTSIEYLLQAQILKEHVGSYLPSPETLMQNIISQLEERTRTLEEKELHSLLVRIYLDNLCKLKNSFEELKTYYSNSCKEFEKRFEELIQSARNSILSNDFQHVAEIFVKISKCLPILKNYFGEQIEEKYRDIIKFLLQHLNSFSKKADTLLVKIRLSNNDIEILKNYIEILKSAKQNSLLQDCVFQMLKNTTDIKQISKDLNFIYSEFIEKIIKYFDNITVKINELLNTNRDLTLENIERLVNDMDSIRTLPDLESKTAEKYYQIAENIRGYMQQLQTNVEQLIVSLQQSETINYKQLARLLSRLKTAEWINRILPGTYDAIIHHITDELVEYSQQLEYSLKKIDLSLKYPDNICIGLEIVKKIESISILERSIPEIEKYRIGISQSFQQCVQEVFDRILKIFDLNQLEEIIQTKKRMIAEREKTKQKYDFSDGLDSSTANNALIYLNQCEKVSYYHIRESAIHNNEILQKYIYEYGQFLNQEINRTFKQICCIDEDLSRYCKELEMRLYELSSLNKFSYVFKCIDGIEKIEQWHQQFLDYYRTLSTNLEEYKCFGKNKEFREQLIIVQALSCVDRFCANLFGDNGFSTLHRGYQKDRVQASKEAFKTVLDYISKEDYAKADIVLHDIDKDLLNSKELYQIRHDLENSLNQLMKKTKSIVIWLEREKDNQDQIKEIKENIDQIRIALNKSNLIDFLDDEIRNNLQNFDNEINQILSEFILKKFHSIEVYIDTDHFLEAEQGIENLNRIQNDLTGYCTSQQCAQLKERLDSTLNNILKRENFADINTYRVNPPKDLLDKLNKLAKHGSAKYQQAYTSMLANVRYNFSLAIEKVRLVPLNERYMKIRSLNHTLCFLSEELKNHFKLQIDDLNKLIVDEEKAYGDDSNDDDDPAITKIAILAQRYRTRNMHELFEILREQTLTDLHTYQTNLQNFADKQDIPSAIDIVKRIFKYKESLGTYFPEIEEVCKNIRLLISKEFLNFCDVFANISSIEQMEIIENAFNNLIIYLNSFDKIIPDFFPKNILQNAREKFQKFFEYLKANSKQYKIALSEMNCIELHKVMMIAKKSNEFLKMINQCPLKHDLIEIMLKEMMISISYTDMSSELEKAINHLINRLDIEFVGDRMKSEEELYKNSMKIINILKAKNSDFKDILLSIVDINKFEEELKKKIENIGNKLIINASTTELLLRDSDYFGMCYNNLLLFDRDIHPIRHVLNVFEETIFERITFLYEQMINSILDITKIAELLIKLKYFREKLSIFNYKIDLKIDEILNIFKEDQSHFRIKQLTMVLDRSEIGRRLINEYHYLNGDDWRNRWEKMRNQDNLSYVLENIHGDNVDKNILAGYYNSFRQIYENLASSILRSFNLQSENGPDLGMLIIQTKMIAGVVAQNLNPVTWDYRIIDRIIELIAHLFAIWTFQNTQYYTATRPYLLIPHTAQVIAIFRLLGIGYDTRMQNTGYPMPFANTNAKLLVNNLVEIGTGEGKSIVLAITACVFALLGLDVNCWCYSEVLSMRDKNNFISIFRALEIEERIVYGNFNKLCEQVANEQCDVREKVRDMILNNKNILTVDKAKEHTRLKVLLMDEVDIFLSEKFYGGIYTPSVILKSHPIKMLLDAIWQNRTVETLNEVKVMSAYNICATKYSNWIFLFDEAIKDMLIALQSFQSSTYLVQNNNIVYVEGESIVDNVTRGYDTIWAYYHESEKGNISQRSLKENVGIIVNCGTFSYAEIPHRFLYIAGVTGTLKTLAEPEKDILRRVYEIHRNTYMPSVYGKSNRIFNSATDIHVVEESEYFKTIRKEIDLVCHASRAILVFFESEEKLMAFYNSTELSSIKQNVKIITEKVSVKERELCIERAGTIGRVTLLTRTFSRGIDFICRNQQLLANGGLHVLQTFFSEELSEEYQIMGRGARQGDRGSYSMILLDKDLDWVLGSAWKKELSTILDSNLYQALNKARTKSYEIKCVVKHLDIEQCRCEHRDSIDFTFALCTGEIKTVKRFLSEQNQGENHSRSVRLQFC